MLGSTSYWNLYAYADQYSPMCDNSFSAPSVIHLLGNTGHQGQCRSVAPQPWRAEDAWHMMSWDACLADAKCLSVVGRYQVSTHLGFARLKRYCVETTLTFLGLLGTVIDNFPRLSCYAVMPSRRCMIPRMVLYCTASRDLD